MALEGSRIRSEILGQALKLVVEKLLGPLWTQITINEVVKLMGVLLDLIGKWTFFLNKSNTYFMVKSYKYLNMCTYVCFSLLQVSMSAMSVGKERIETRLGP